MRHGNAAESAFTARVAQAVILLRKNGYGDVAALIQKQEKAQRAPTRRAKRKVSVRSSTGRAVKGSAFWMDGVDLARGERIEDET